MYYVNFLRGVINNLGGYRVDFPYVLLITHGYWLELLITMKDPPPPGVGWSGMGIDMVLAPHKPQGQVRQYA